MKSERVFSGIQPSGSIHIGNYLGAIKNWVSLLDSYECFFCIVDYHAMTIPYDPGQMPGRIKDAVIVNIACGLDPERCNVFIQSHVPLHTELAWVFNCITPIGDLERMTQFKEKSKQHRSGVNMGLLDYPVLQAADILLYKAKWVPVGEDQVQHLELSREVARRFNKTFKPIFPEPQPLLTPTGRIMGIDGKSKMSKSLNNAIDILDTPENLWEKLKIAYTDPARLRKSDPGNPDICNIFTMHKGFSLQDEMKTINNDCRNAGIGCIECKKILKKNILSEFEPVREKITYLTDNPDLVSQYLETGARKCQEIAREVMDEVLLATGLRT